MEDRFKFRFWYNQTNEMIDDTGFKGCLRDIDWDDFVYDGDIMQCTGLKDKNGTLEYQGDILKTPDGSICFIINDGFRWAVESPGSCAVDYENKKFFESCEIIGNIYENLELLNA